MRKLVLVEDDLDLFTLLKYNLEKEGFRVAGAHRGAGVSELCLCERPDLVLLDVMLPDCDGFDVCKLLRANAQLAATPIIFITARASETDRVIGLELGAVDYIVKPFFMREVIARISSVRPVFLDSILGSAIPKASVIRAIGLPPSCKVAALTWRAYSEAGMPGESLAVGIDQRDLLPGKVYEHGQFAEAGKPFVAFHPDDRLTGQPGRQERRWFVFGSKADRDIRVHRGR